VADDQPVVLDDDPVDDQLCRRRVDAGPSAFSVQESTSFIGFYIFCSKIRRCCSA
jgi:hypothetical protein